MVLAIGLCGPAAAQDDDARAREFYENGALLYEEGRYADAIVAWEEAYKMSERPLLLYNIANAQERLGQWRAALETLNRYRVYAPAEERDRLDRRIANLERRLEEQAAPQPAVVPAPVEGVAMEPESSVVVPWGGVALLGGGALALGGGSLFAIQAVNARERAAAYCVDGEAGVLCSSAASADLRADTRNALLADGLFVVGLLGVGFGTKVLLSHPGVSVTVGTGHIHVLRVF